MSQFLRAFGLLVLLAVATPTASQAAQPDQAPPEYPAIFRETFKGHTDRVVCVAVGAEGTTVASGGADNTVRLWDTMTGEQQHLLQHAGTINCLAFSADGKKLAVGDATALVTLWDVNTGEKLATLNGIAGPVYQVALAGDGKTVGAAGAKSGMLWDVESGKTKMTFKGGRFALSLNGKTLAWSRADGAIIFWDLITDGPTGSAEGHKEGVYALTFSPDGKTLASGGFAGGLKGSGEDKSIKLWDIPLGTELTKLEGHRKGIYSLTFAPDGKFLLAADFNGSIKLWDLDKARIKATLEKVKVGERLTGTPVGSWAFAPDLKTWAVGTGKEVLWLDIADFTGAVQ